MKDKDAQLLRTLLLTYGWERVLQELYNMARAYSAQHPSWVLVRKHLRKALVAKIGKYRLKEAV